MSDPKVASVSGTITLADGSVSEFVIGTDYGWQQWGATRERLGTTVGVLEGMVEGMKNAEVRFVSDNDEPEEDDDDGEATDADLVGPLAGVDEDGNVTIRKEDDDA